jgi:hypothetical protein
MASPGTRPAARLPPRRRSGDALAYTGDVSTEDLDALHGPAAAETRTPSRPGLIRWLWYALGGSLPVRFSPWVLHDTTTRTWALRHVLRSLVQLSVPIALVLFLVPGEFWIRGMAALGGVFLALFFSLAYMPETTESRVKRAGYPAGTATATRERLGQERQAAERRRRREAVGRRGARCRARHER